MQAVVTGVVPFPPFRLLPSLLLAHRVQHPLIVDFSSSVANSRSRAFRKSISAQKKAHKNLYEYAHGVFGLTKLNRTRLKDNNSLIHPRGSE